MPYIKPFSAGDRAEHPESYWTLVRFQADLTAEIGTLTLAGYHDAAAWSEGAGQIAGAERSYHLAGDEFRLAIGLHLAGAEHLGDLADRLAAADPFFADAAAIPYPTPGG